MAFFSWIFDFTVYLTFFLVKLWLYDLRWIWWICKYLIYIIFLSSSFFFDLVTSEIIWVFSLKFVSFWLPEIRDFIISEYLRFFLWLNDLRIYLTFLLVTFVSFSSYICDHKLTKIRRKNSNSHISSKRIFEFFHVFSPKCTSYWFEGISQVWSSNIWVEVLSYFSSSQPAWWFKLLPSSGRFFFKPTNSDSFIHRRSSGGLFYLFYASAQMMMFLCFIIMHPAAGKHPVKDNKSSLRPTIHHFT